MCPQKLITIPPILKPVHCHHLLVKIIFIVTPKKVNDLVKEQMKHLARKDAALFIQKLGIRVSHINII